MTPEAIDAAADRIAGQIRLTPILTSPFLDEIAGRRVFIKAECLQITGSFKFRGATNAVSRASGDVLAYSSGNHAQGVAKAAQRARRQAVIIMPSDAPALKIENTRAFGAEVVLYDRAGGESREEIGAALARDRGLHLIKPYDDPDVIAGQGTVGLELARQLPPDVAGDVLVCCGGGGLTSGIALALENRRPQLRVRPVEPVGFDDVKRSLEAGEILSNRGSTGSICDAIVTPSPGVLTFPILSRLCGPGLAVTDDQALRAMALAMLRLKLVTEPGGAVSLAAALFQAKEIEGEAVTVVLTGGNADPQMMTRALATL